MKQTLQIALARHQTGQFQQAELLYRQVLAMQPDHADALHLLALVLHQTGRHAEALPLLSKALSLRPSTGEFHNTLSAVLLATGKTEPAITAARRAVELKPILPEAWLNLGNALASHRQLPAAIGCFQKAIQLQPNLAPAHLGLGNALVEVKQIDQGIEAYQQAISLQPSLADAHCNLANALVLRQKHEQAVVLYHNVLSIRPDHFGAANNLATALMQLNRTEEAIASLQRALNVTPNHPALLNALGTIYSETHDSVRAIDTYTIALSFDPDFHEARYNLAVAFLTQGDYAQGWIEYESRFLNRIVPRYTAKPRWNGEPLFGRRILIHAEQGMGDTLQFIRYLPLVAASGGRVIVQVQPALLKLLENFFSIYEITADDVSDSNFDVQCPMLSLPLIFNTTLNSIPPIPRGFNISPDKARNFGDRLHNLDPSAKSLKVGLVWSGSPLFAHNDRRSFMLNQLAPLSEIDHVTFISLQKGPAASQAATPPNGMRLTDWTDELNDFADTAALISNLDLVITPDTGTAHLAASMGIPTWILLMHTPDFRWLRNREDSPWCPAVTLFRQPERGDWVRPIQHAAARLKELASARY